MQTELHLVKLYAIRYNMVKRTFWLKLVNKYWKEKNIIWLAGVRRVGKTYLCKSISGVEYFDCELPRIRIRMQDPELFLDHIKGKKVVIDEIHRLSNPSEILKIAADYYPQTKIIATGSSTLGASKKFKDTLTGRKKNLWLTPMISNDLVDFKNNNLEYRLLKGGLPPFFLSKGITDSDYQEWLDSFWAKDIQELFRLQQKNSFQRFIELLFTKSGGIFEANKFSTPCEVSRTTIANYLAILENTLIVHIVRPYSTKKSSEIISAPKVYAFDTGFVAYYKGWNELHNEDKGILFEHLVISELIAYSQSLKLYYWRDKIGHEIDFIKLEKNKSLTAIECKWDYNNFDPKNLIVFRKKYPHGRNILVSNNVKESFNKKYGSINVKIINLAHIGSSIFRPQE